MVVDAAVVLLYGVLLVGAPDVCGIDPARVALLQEARL
jgi:hypothetical protein